MTTIYTRNTVPTSGGTLPQATGSKPGPGQIGPGSKGPEVRELKQLLKDAGFYNGAINDEMGSMGVDALKRAKAQLKLGGPRTSPAPPPSRR
jgi:peptidoglycan hydrolase-like protein with peptidoglycan-binding domain